MCVLLFEVDVLVVLVVCVTYVSCPVFYHTYGSVILYYTQL